MTISKIVVGTRDKEGKPAIFHVTEDNWQAAAKEVWDAMVDEGVTNPVVLTRIDNTITIEEIEPTLA